MIDFAVVGLARSGTAWIANLFSSDGVLCWHDPLENQSLSDLHRWAAQRDGISGIADTSLGIMPELLTDSVHRLRAIKVVRPIREINASLEKCGLSFRYNNAHYAALNTVPGPCVEFGQLHDYDVMNAAFHYLTGGLRQLDRERFELLCKLNVQRHPAKYAPDYSILEQMINDYHAKRGETEI